MPWMDSAGDWHGTDSFACGDAAECHADDHVYCTPDPAEED